MQPRATQTESIDRETSRWLVRLRWSALIGLSLGAAFELSLAPSDTARTGFAIAWLVLGISNLIAAQALAKHDSLPARTLASMLFLDIVLLTLVLAVTGGPANPFSVLYLVHIALTAAVLGSRLTWAMAVSSVLAFGALFLIGPEAATAPHAHHAMHGHHHQNAGHQVAAHHAADEGFSNHLRGMWLAFALAAALISYFASKILDSLKARNAQVAAMKLAIEQNTRFASLVTLAAGAAHELGSPLATIAVVSGDLAHAASNNPALHSLKEDASLLQREVRRCRAILDEMRYQADSAGPESWGTWTRSELAEAVHAEATSKNARIAPIQLVGIPQSIELPPYGVQRALSSLIANAHDAEPNGQPLEIRVLVARNELRISVTDFGPGMSDEVLARATEPFFTTKPTGLGMGLGLFLVRTFCEQHGGSFVLESALGQGTTATIVLPQEQATESIKRHANG